MDNLAVGPTNGKSTSTKIVPLDKTNNIKSPNSTTNSSSVTHNTSTPTKTTTLANKTTTLTDDSNGTMYNKKDLTKILPSAQNASSTIEALSQEKKSAVHHRWSHVKALVKVGTLHKEVIRKRAAAACCVTIVISVTVTMICLSIIVAVAVGLSYAVAKEKVDYRGFAGQEILNGCVIIK